MSILPSFLEELSNIDIAESEENKVIEVPREYGIDFTTGQLTGKIVEGLEAIKVRDSGTLYTQAIMAHLSNNILAMCLVMSI